jgi:hypothetical protein
MKTKLFIALNILFLVLPAQAEFKVFILAGQSNMQGAGQVKANPNSHSKGKGSNGLGNTLNKFLIPDLVPGHGNRADPILVRQSGRRDID